jgi:hypothetical protein
MPSIFMMVTHEKVSLGLEGFWRCIKGEFHLLDELHLPDEFHLLGELYLLETLQVIGLRFS